MPHKEITVKSRAYGEHTRAARGSKTPVRLNEAFEKHKAKTVVVNSTARRVHHSLKMFSGDFKEAMLWQAMLSRMRKAASDDQMVLVAALNGMELNAKYPLLRFLPISSVKVEKDKKKITVRFGSNLPPYIKSNDTQYCLEVHLLLLGKKEKQDSLASARTEWIRKETSAGELMFSLDLPDKVTCYVVCLHFMTGSNGKETGTLASRGMRIAGVGEV